MSDKPCYVYLMKAEHIRVFGDEVMHLVKVGIADSPRARLQQLVTSCPYKLSVYRTWKLPSRRDAFAIERRSHDLYADHRTRGEWFLESLQEIEAGITCSVLMHWTETLGNPPDTLPAFLRFVGFAEEDVEDWVCGWFGHPSEWPAGLTLAVVS